MVGRWQRDSWHWLLRSAQSSGWQWRCKIKPWASTSVAETRFRVPCTSSCLWYSRSCQGSACGIVAIPVYAARGKFEVASGLIAIVFLEVLVLVTNRWRCPLTNVAARFTDDRRDNFDIYLPLWIARHNKTIFGWLFVAGLLFTLARWRGWVG